jgi:hypothetical protein
VAAFERSVTSLRPLFDEWNQIVSEGVLHYCLETDAKDIQYLDTFKPRGVVGVSPEHAHIKEMVAETVARMRALAGRLERGETHLKNIP